MTHLICGIDGIKGLYFAVTGLLFSSVLLYYRIIMNEGGITAMTPEVRIRAIRLMERFHEQTEYLHSIGVDIVFRNFNVETENDHADD